MPCIFEKTRVTCSDPPRPVPRGHWCKGLKHWVGLPEVLCSNCPGPMKFTVDHVNLYPEPLYPNADRWGVLFRWRSFWVGLHYSTSHKRFCLNLIPCVTIWWTRKGGDVPKDVL